MPSDRKSHKEVNSLLEALIALPIKSLERKIWQLQKDIKEREKLRNGHLTNLSTKRLHLQDINKKLNYFNVFDSRFKDKMAICQQISEIETTISDEKLTSFKDLIELKGKLDHAQEELERAKRKLGLLKG